ncbi:2-oxo-tetronate isomerase [Methylibium petroleiphilum]|uniref:2-oxo-tetronate isomerase n=1 Tax=Methylibium petroleiphilum TaxID=105560 RepID=UPI001AD5EFA1|nr:2-oxo-tetronate isomerase [Methylibium petroleiphilum]MBN9205646.1 hydroxypyruvate isomerase family protein [Methylibium petroleiphilum]
MPRFAANLTLLYTELPFLDRAAAAARDGFEAVECQFPYEHSAAEFAARLADSGLPLVLMNAPPGDATANERGLAALPGREADFRRAIDTALTYAGAMRCPRVHVMAGRLPAGAERAALQPTFVENLAWAARQAAGTGIELLIEPINLRDMPGYFLNRQDHAHEIVQLVNAPNLKVQMDLYHCQVVEGDVAMKLRQYLPTGRVGHLQVAGVPERQEPDIGELNAAYLFDVIDELGYPGWVGCEYKPRRETRAGLGWRPVR